ncbi:hypothetical protein G9A89_003578 [Geosiphon pyriformis]|nr:hypothetical protein G9A89_003578 [Geosiphon pyriformis]
MVFKYGFAIGENVGSMSITSARIMTPLHVPNVISLSVTNSTRFLLIGTKPEILEWIYDHPTILIETSLFDNPNEAPHIPLPDIIIDLLPCYDSDAHATHQKSFLQSLNPLSHPDPATEPVRLEFRAVNQTLDEEINEWYFRIVIQKGKNLAEVFQRVSEEWSKVQYPSLWDNIKKVAGVGVQAYNEVEEQVENYKKVEEQHHGNESVSYENESTEGD